MDKPKPITKQGVMPSEIPDRMPPSNLDAEQQVLGSILLLPSVLDEVASILKPQDFYTEANERIYGHLLAMSTAGDQIDNALLAEKLKCHGDWEFIGEAAYLGEVAQAAPTAAHAVHYARIVLRASQKRRIMQAATELLKEAWEPSIEPEQSLASAEAALQEIRTGDYQDSLVTAQQAGEAFLLKVSRICQQQGQVGVFTGLPRFDSEVGGLFPGELTILAARPSVGKTALACQIADHSARHGRLVYFASLEMDFVELAGRTICGIAGVNGQVIRTGKIGPEEQQALSNGAAAFSKRAVCIDSRPGMTVYDIRRAARRLVRDALRLIVVDYLQLLTPEDRRLQRYEQVGQQTKALKELARELEVPVLCLCQLNRASEQQEMPMLSNLRESGSIEQDADMVMLLHRPPSGIKISTPGSRTKERAAWPAELILAKNRNGEQVTVKLDWDPRLTRFSCWDDGRLLNNAAEEAF